MTVLCECVNGMCVNCTRPMKRCDAKRHCRAYATPARQRQPVTQAAVGSALSNILAAMGFKKTENCSCRSLESAMNAGGRSWCLSRIGVLAAAVSENARKSGYYCPRIVASCLIIVAIVLSRIFHGQKA